ncbi:putative glutamine ABC transporter permease protein GlnM [Pararobbsia alpina]|uniref:amino acid ABC transporter permease n=1 Tax=Pararobbsia alpina TaxID=621374 RepID=UPI0039A55436
MNHGLDVIWIHRSELLAGLLSTTALSALSAACSLVTGTVLSTVLMSRQRVPASMARVFVDLMRCTPFLLLVYVIYYGLPSFGIRLDNISAGFFGLVIYNTAYVAEILRAGWANRPREELEAGHAFGFHGVQLVRRLVLPPVFYSSAPMLGNQFIQIVKDSSFLTIIAVPELTYAANNIQSNHYIPFAAFIAAVLLYWIVCSAIELIVSAMRRVSEQYQ